MNTLARWHVNIRRLSTIGNRSNDGLASMSRVGIALDGQCLGAVSRTAQQPARFAGRSVAAVALSRMGRQDAAGRRHGQDAPGALTPQSEAFTPRCRRSPNRAAPPGADAGQRSRSERMGGGGRDVVVHPPNRAAPFASQGETLGLRPSMGAAEGTPAPTRTPTPTQHPTVAHPETRQPGNTASFTSPF
jgi:hypothetical protein